MSDGEDDLQNKGGDWEGENRDMIICKKRRADDTIHNLLEDIYIYIFSISRNCWGLYSSSFKYD